MSAFTSALVPALEKRYSICATARRPRGAQRRDLGGQHPGLAATG